MTASRDRKEELKSSKIKEIYRYDEMSNKVLKADRSLQTVQTDPLRDAELSQPKSMKGRISARDMGSSIKKGLDNGERQEAEKEVNTLTSIQLNETTKKTNNLNIINNSTVLGNNNELRLNYYPTTAENIEYYGNVLNWVVDILGNDMPYDIITGTADLIITTLKQGAENSDGLIDNKRLIIEKDIGIKISPTNFTEVFKTIQKISDFGRHSKDFKNDEVVTVLANSDEEDDEEEEDLNTLEQEINLDIEHDDDDFTTDITNTKDIQSVPQIEKGEIFTLSSKKLEIPVISDISDKFIKNIIGEKADLTGAQLRDILNKHEHDEKTLKKSITTYFSIPDETIIDFIINHKTKLLWGLRINLAQNNEKQNVLNEMENNNLHNLVQEYTSTFEDQRKRVHEDDSSNSNEDTLKRAKNPEVDDLEIIDLNTIKFDQGSNFMTNTTVALPEGSFKRIKPDYDEIYIPAPKKAEINYDLVPISELPEWARRAFLSGETETLNAVQSKVYPIAFKSDHNMLLCAPTGAGKTNVAMLTILRTLSQHYNINSNKVNLKNFKIVYVAPLKALVQEQVREFQRRLAPYGIKVSELTGDSRLTRAEIESTQILVSTPEKWDIVTRKTNDSWFTELVKLIIIDEIHLLHDERGPVIESIVSRTLRSNNYRDKPRIIGLSATLPNYRDVGTFLRAPEEAIFYFDSSYRPCPLTQQFCGIKSQGSLKKLNAMNEACYEKAFESVSENNQIIIFVHSRKDTGRTGQWLRNKFLETENLEKLSNKESGSKEILKSESENVQDPDLKSLLIHGIGIHHAGLSREDRTLSEDLFADGLLKVLVSTATLAWGVNLPAHTVIIKGTDVYSPEKGGWERLSPQDILQMLGRAGRPRYDTHGDGIIITSQSDIQYYLAVLNQQLPIESQLVSKIVDNLNAEVVSGNVKSINDGIDWLSYTYFYVRILAASDLYKVVNTDEDKNLLHFRRNLIHTTFHILAQQGLLIYDRDTGNVIATELGRIASYFYIKYDSMNIYNKELDMNTSLIDIFRIFTLSDEFKYIASRPEEIKELKELFERAPIPIKGEISEPLTKVNILLQAYISNLKLDGFALNADMIYIQQSAGRILRAMLELCLKKGWSASTKSLLSLCKSVDKRMWMTNSPLRQFKRCPVEVIKRTEASNLPWQEYLSLSSPSEVGYAIRTEKYGKLVYDLLDKFPKLTLECAIQPITPSLLNVELAVFPHWKWDVNIHCSAESFIILVEDISGNEIIYTDTILIKQESMSKELTIDFSILLTASQQKRLPPNFFVSVISEKWIQCEAQIAVRLENVNMPKKFPATNDLEDMDLIEAATINNKFGEVFDFEKFNLIQSNVFEALYHTNENIFIGCPKGSGKTVMAEIAFLNHWRQNGGRILYICPSKIKIEKLTKSWTKKFSNVAGGKAVNKLGHILSENRRIIAENHLTLATPEQFNILSRRWRQRKNIQRIDLTVFDDVQEVGNGLEGTIYETVISRMMFILTNLETQNRIVSLSTSIANSRDFASWLGVKKANIFNFSPLDRFVPIKIQLEAEESLIHGNISEVLVNSLFDLTCSSNNDDTTPLIFVPTRRDCIETSGRLSSLAKWKKIDFLKGEQEELNKHIEDFNDRSLITSLRNGIGFIYKDMNNKARKIVEKLYEFGRLSVLLVCKDCCYDSPRSSLVVILGTQILDVREHHLRSYTVNELLEMVGSVKPQENSNNYPGKVIIYTNTTKKAYYKKFLQEPLPTESFMYFRLHDAFINGISNSIIENKQECVDWITYTYFYRRIHANPTFYGVKNNTEYGISAYLTELVESTLNDLAKLSLIEIQEPKNTSSGESEDESSLERISPLNGCLISSHNNVRFLTMHSFISNATRDLKLANILELLSSADEFEDISLRKEDYPRLIRLQNLVPLKFKGVSDTDSTSFKVFILLQAYFSRMALPIDLETDLKLILPKSVSLINALVDILSGNGYLNAIIAMDVSQMIIQAVWDVDSPLRQVPYFDAQILSKCATMKIETVYDVMALEDEDREEILTMDNKKLVTVANFINSYPNIEMKYTFEDSKNVKTDKMNQITVEIIRDDEPDSLSVVSEKYPNEKDENWWLVIGELSTRELYAIKKVALKAEKNDFKMEFALPTTGEHTISIWCICDSYVDADKEVSFKVNAH